jgi:hypothetical protein
VNWKFYDLFYVFNMSTTKRQAEGVFALGLIRPLVGLRLVALFFFQTATTREKSKGTQQQAVYCSE